MFPVSATLHPRPYQLEAATCLDHAIWEEGGKPALAVLPVAGGKTVILLLAALAGVERGHDVVVVSRSFHVAKQSLEMLAHSS